MSIFGIIIEMLHEVGTIGDNHPVWILYNGQIAEFDLFDTLGSRIQELITDRINTFFAYAFALFSEFLSRGKDMFVNIGDHFLGILDFVSVSNTGIQLDNFVSLFIGVILYIFIFKLAFELIKLIINTIFGLL